MSKSNNHNVKDNDKLINSRPDPSDELEFPAEFETPVVVPIEDYLDLHHFSPKEVKLIVPEYLHQAQLAGFTVVRIIHGKGIGVQREIVRSLLQRSPLVRAFQDAPPSKGDWGATLVQLNSATIE
jgi:DNA-nicking Smr family endonuclease